MAPENVVSDVKNVVSDVKNVVSGVKNVVSGVKNVVNSSTKLCHERTNHGQSRHSSQTLQTSNLQAKHEGGSAHIVNSLFSMW